MRKYQQRFATMCDVPSQGHFSIPVGEEPFKCFQNALDSPGAHRLCPQRQHAVTIPFYSSIISTIHQCSCDVIVTTTDHLKEYEQRFCKVMMRRSVDEIIMFPSHLTDEDIDHLLQPARAEIVVLGEFIHHQAVDIGHDDNELAAYKAVRWLMEQK